MGKQIQVRSVGYYSVVFFFFKELWVLLTPSVISQPLLCAG